MTTIEFSQKTATGLGPVLRDLKEGVRNYRIWTALALEMLKNRYRRSALGIIWIVLSFIMLTLALVLFFGGLGSAQGREFMVYVSLGLVAYEFLLGCLTGGCLVYVSSSNWIKSVKLPYSTYVFSSILKGLMPLVIQLATATVIAILVGWRPTWYALLAFPALAMILINAVWVYMFLGILAARYRDIQHFIGSLGRMLFFLTPVFWYPGTKGGIIEALSLLNPLTHFVEIFRAPLLGSLPTATNLIYVAVMTVLGWCLALATASVLQRRVPFWVG